MARPGFTPASAGETTGVLVALFGPLIVVLMAVLLLGAAALERWAQATQPPTDPIAIAELGETPT